MCLYSIVLVNSAFFIPNRLLPSRRQKREFHNLGLPDSLQENCAIELLRVMRPMMGAFDHRIYSTINSHK